MCYTEAKQRYFEQSSLESPCSHRASPPRVIAHPPPYRTLISDSSAQKGQTLALRRGVWGNQTTLRPCFLLGIETRPAPCRREPPEARREQTGEAALFTHGTRGQYEKVCSTHVSTMSTAIQKIYLEVFYMIYFVIF